MDAEQACMAQPDDLDEPKEYEPGDESGCWEDDELTPEELTRWLDAVSTDENARAPQECSVADAFEPGLQSRPDGSLPDLIAAALGASGDPALMTDADLVQSLAAWHAVASRAVGREMRATEELLRRRKPRLRDRRAGRSGRASRSSRTSAPDGAEEQERAMPAVVASREAAAEIALALNATEYGALAQAELAANLSRRLPAAFRELDAGRADLYRVRLLAEATQFLSDEDAGQVDALLAPSLGQMTGGDLRDKARKAVNKIDAKAADRRRERAERKARFALYGNEDMTATAAVERMPAHLGAAVKARVNAIARAAKAAGMTDPMPLLEAKVATGLLLDTLPDIPPPADDGSADDGSAGGPPPAGPDWPSDWFTGPGTPDDGGSSDDDAAPSAPEVPDFADFEPESAGDEEPGPAEAGAMIWPGIPAQAGAAAPGCQGVPAWLRPKDPGRIRLLVPWRSLTGMGQEPGELSWIGPVTPVQARELAMAAAADPDCTWRLIVTDEEGRAVAITALRTRRGAGPPGLVSEVTLTISQSLAAAFGREGQEVNLDHASMGTLADLLADAIPAANLAATQAAARMAADRDAGGCAHTMEVPGYRIPDRLRRWLTTRDRTCRNPVCRQPAVRCDQDHTIAYDRGGPTCCCNLGGLCRFHHKLKQLPGWHLSQAQGTFTWRTPAGLTYRKEPHRYPL